MSLRELMFYVNKEQIKIELWRVGDEEHEIIEWYEYEKIEKYKDYDVCGIRPIVWAYNSPFEQNVIVKPFLVICVDLFEDWKGE